MQLYALTEELHRSPWVALSLSSPKTALNPEITKLTRLLSEGLFAALHPRSAQGVEIWWLEEISCLGFFKYRATIDGNILYKDYFGIENLLRTSNIKAALKT